MAYAAQSSTLRRLRLPTCGVYRDSLMADSSDDLERPTDIRHLRRLAENSTDILDESGELMKAFQGGLFCPRIRTEAVLPIRPRLSWHDEQRAGF